MRKREPVLSVVIPALDEAAHLPLLLSDLARQSCECEVIVADGGSRDATAARAQARGARVLHTARGRAIQMNAAAAAAQGEHLLFLHADTRIETPELLSQALRALCDAERQAAGRGVAGHFALRFARSRSGHERFYRFVEGKTRLNRPYTINGDQGMLLSRAFFEALGRYDESLPFFEDQRIAARIFAAGEWVLLPGELVTSARRFETEGEGPRYALMGLMMALHAAQLDEFFERVPAVYRAQAEAGALELSAFGDLALHMLRERGLNAAGNLLHAGRMLRENAWQLAYLVDVLRQDPRLQRLALFDRRIAPIIDNPVGDAAAAGLAMAVLLAAGPVAAASARWARLVSKLPDAHRGRR